MLPLPTLGHNRTWWNTHIFDMGRRSVRKLLGRSAMYGKALFFRVPSMTETTSSFRRFRGTTLFYEKVGRFC